MAEGVRLERRNILVAMDGSVHAEYALDWYMNHMRKANDHVIIVHVAHVLKLPTNQASIIGRERLSGEIQQEEANIAMELHKLGDKLRKHHVRGEVKHVDVREPGEGILKAADDFHADMIVMGSRGRGALCRTLLGSVSDFVVHHSHIPVTICKDPHHRPRSSLSTSSQ